LVQQAATTAAMSLWLSDTLGEKKVSKILASKRLVSHPAVISDEHNSGAVRRMMRSLQNDVDDIPAQVFEVRTAVCKTAVLSNPLLNAEG
jgi:HSP90 family molecular chaperone